MQDSFDNASQLHESKIDAKAPASRGFALQQRGGAACRSRRPPFRCPRAIGTIVILLFLGMLAWNCPHGNTTFQFAQTFQGLVSLTGAHTLRTQPANFKHAIGVSAKSRNWLELQEQSTLREIISLAKPRSQGFVARIYSPLVVISKHAHRDLSADKVTFLSFPIDSFTPSKPWHIIVISCCLLALVISTYAFLSSLSERANQIPKSDSLSTIQYLRRGHSLDVYIMSASERHYIASVGFDHQLRFWNLHSRESCSHLPALSELHGLWPVIAISCDDRGEWLAICSRLGDVGIWNVKDRSFRRHISTGFEAQVALCFFMTTPPRESPNPVTPLLVVSTNGNLADIDSESGLVTFHQICTKKIRSSQLNSRRRIPLRLITITEDDEIYFTVKREDCWVSQALHIPLTIVPQPSRLIYTTIPNLKMVGLAFGTTTNQLHLIDFLSG